MKEWKIHTLAWITWFTAFAVSYQFRGPSLVLYIVSPVLMLIGYMFLFYGTVASLHKFWEKNKVVLVLSIIVIGALHIEFRLFSFYYLLPSIDSNFVFTKYNLPQSVFAIRTILWVVSIVFAAVGYYFAKRSIAELKKQNFLERTLLETETQLIKAQLNPHFLFNVLNFMYDKSYGVSKDLSESITLLSEMMRYSISSKGINERVSLCDELHHINNFIKLNRIRFHGQLSVCFEEEGCTEEKKIIPFVLINYVENALKHGIIDEKENPVRIRVSAHVNSLSFLVANKKSVYLRGKSISHGIGNFNTKKRLDYAYQDNYELIIEDKKDYFSCALTINE